MVDKLVGSMVEEMARAICARELAYHDCETPCMAAGKCVGKLSKSIIEDAQACAAIAQKRVNELEAALEPFARVAAIADHLPSRVPDETPCREFFPGIWPTLGDCRKARAALPTMLKGNGDG